jgi:hypothetical protein
LVVSALAAGELRRNSATGVWIEPFDGWGFLETVDGRLAPAFEARIDEAGVDTGGGIKGWRGSVASPAHKYSGMPLVMRPRHTHWSGMVTTEVGSADRIAYSGLAVTSGLECDWL